MTPRVLTSSEKESTPISQSGMNIKGLLGPHITTLLKPIDKGDRSIRSDKSHDRDANGQQTRDQGDDHPKERMTDEALEKAIQYLKELPAVKEHKWTVHLEINNQDERIIYIKDNLGQVIRRVKEAELWTLPLSESGEHKGQIFKRIA